MCPLATTTLMMKYSATFLKKRENSLKSYWLSPQSKSLFVSVGQRGDKSILFECFEQKECYSIGLWNLLYMPFNNGRVCVLAWRGVCALTCFQPIVKRCFFSLSSSRQRLPAAKCLMHPWIAKLRPSVLNSSLSSLDSPLALDSSSSAEPSQNSSNSSSFAPAPGPTVEPAATSSSGFSRPEDMTKVSEKMAAVCIEKQREEEERKDMPLGCGSMPATPTLAVVMDTKVTGTGTIHHHTRALSYQGSMCVDSDPSPSPSSPVPSVVEEGYEGKGDGMGRSGVSRPSSRSAVNVSTAMADCLSYDPKTLEKLVKYEQLKQRRIRVDPPGSPPPPATGETRVSSAGSVRRPSECVLPDLKKGVDTGKDKEQAPQGEKTASQGDKQAPHGEKMAYQGEKQAPQGEKMAYQGEKQAPQGEKTASQGEKQVPHGEKMAYQGEKIALQGENNLSSECGGLHVLVSPKTPSSHERFTTASPEKMMRNSGRSGTSLHTAFEKPKVSDVKEPKVEPVPKETKVEPVAKETKVEPVLRETKVEPVVKETKVESTVKEAKMEPVVKETKVESTVKEAKVEPVVKETKVEPVVKETKVEPPVKDARVEPAVKELKQLKNSKLLGSNFQKEHAPTTDSPHASRQTAVAKQTTELPEVTKPAAKFSEPLKASETTTRVGDSFKTEKSTKCIDPPASSDIATETGRHTTVLVQTVSRTHVAEKGSHTHIKAGSGEQHREGTEVPGPDRPLRRNISASSIKVDVTRDKAEEKRDAPPPAIVLEVRRTSSVEPSRGTSTELSRGTSVEPSRGTCMEPSRGTSVEPSRGTSVEPSRRGSGDTSKQSTPEPTKIPSKTMSLEPSRGLSSESSNEASSNSEQSKGATTEPSRGPSSESFKGATAEPSRGPSSESFKGATAEPSRGPSSESSKGVTAECSQGSVSTATATTMGVSSPTTAECDGDAVVVRKRHKTPADDHKKQLKTQWRKTPQISEEAQMAILLGEIPDDDHAHTHMMTADSCKQPAPAMLETCVEEEEVKVESPDPTSVEEVARRTGRTSHPYHSAILSTSPERTEEVPKLRPKGSPASISSLLQTPTGEEDDEFNQKTDVFLSPIHRFRSSSMSHSHSTPDLSALSMDELSKAKCRTVERSNSRRCKNRVSITEDGYVTSSHQAMQSKHLGAATRSKPLFPTSKLSSASTSIASRIRIKLGFNS